MSADARAKEPRSLIRSEITKDSLRLPDGALYRDFDFTVREYPDRSKRQEFVWIGLSPMRYMDVPERQFFQFEWAFQFRLRTDDFRPQLQVFSESSAAGEPHQDLLFEAEHKHIQKDMRPGRYRIRVSSLPNGEGSKTGAFELEVMTFLRTWVHYDKAGRLVMSGVRGVDAQLEKEGGRSQASPWRTVRRVFNRAPGRGEPEPLRWHGVLGPSSKTLVGGEFYEMYSFHAKSGQTATISMKSSEFNTFLEVYETFEDSSKNRKLMSNDNRNPSDPAEGSRIVLKGLADDRGYVVHATSARAGETGEFEVTITLTD